MPTRTHTQGKGPETVQKCHLLEFPPELRLLIYEFVYAGGYKHVLFIDNVMAVSTWPSTIDNDRRKYFTALLRTCTLICNEAEPILYEATPFNIYIEGVPRSIMGCWKGKLDTCPFIRHITNIKSLDISVPDMDNSEDNAVRCVEGLINALPNYKRYKVDSIGLCRGDDSWAQNNCVITALMGLKCKPGVKFVLCEGRVEVKLADCVSESIYGELVRKLGIKKDQGTD
ncbi:hypothetical protein LTS10_009725 [Elasticomyces elasticus]|nr:hypothetical protein LTS10_009725 [Elasticomyces elasticus]